MLKSKRGSSNDNPLLVSIITIVYDNVKYIRDSIQSVLEQDYPFIEYIVIDGGSKDGTIDVIKEYEGEIAVFVSESDAGIYDALNKGIERSGGDVIAILHSDDVFSDEHVVTDMVQHMVDSKSEFSFADMLIVDDNDKVIRYYMAHYFNPWLIKIGWLPPHPTWFINKSLFTEFGLYSLEYPLAGDFDFFVRIFSLREIDWSYLNRITVKMRSGGASNSGLSSKKRTACEIRKSLKQNKIWSCSLLQWLRYFVRALEFVLRPGK